MKKIYKIYSPNNTNCYYIGKCGGYLSMRLCQHRYYYNRANDSGAVAGTFYTSYWIIQQGDAVIELIEEVEDDKAREREDFWIDEYKRLGYEVVNYNKSYGIDLDKQRKTAMRHYYKKRDVCLERCRNYYWNNVEERREYQRKRYHLKKHGNLDTFVPKVQSSATLQTCLSNTEVEE